VIVPRQRQFHANGKRIVPRSRRHLLTPEILTLSASRSTSPRASGASSGPLHLRALVLRVAVGAALRERPLLTTPIYLFNVSLEQIAFGFPLEGIRACPHRSIGGRSRPGAMDDLRARCRYPPA